MRTRTVSRFIVSLLFVSATLCIASEADQEPIGNWESIRSQRWVGPNLWANRLQDWEIRDGFLMPTNGDPEYPVRTVHAITREVLARRGSYFLSVRISSEVRANPRARVGFLIGAGSGLLDWRAAAVVHSNSGKGGGLLAFLELGEAQRLTFRDMSREFKAREYIELAGEPLRQEIALSRESELLLRLEVRPSSVGSGYDLRLVLEDAESGKRLGLVELPGRAGHEVTGSVALAYSSIQEVSRPVIRLRGFRVWGPKVRNRPERAFGPVMGTLYTVAHGVLKMTAQFAPVAFQGDTEERFPVPLKAYLEIKTGKGWEAADSSRISHPDYTAHFRVRGWEGSDKERPFRIAYTGQDSRQYYYEGAIAREPEPGEEFSLAAFTGMGVMGRTADSGPAPSDKGPVVGRWTPANMWFPFEEAARNLSEHKVDLLCFTGDQIYENKPTAPLQYDRFPVLDYLYKWYLWHWAFGELTRRRPAVCQTDDHDVYQGNVWGWGGRLNMVGHNAYGGYMKDALFVRLVERTQTAHLPDPFDPSPILNDIGVYYTGFSYGGVSFAVLEDRKFKSSPRMESSQAGLLGARQLDFLEHWATDWRAASVKVVLSQSIYATVQTNKEGRIWPNRDSHGWPKHGRDKAITAMRKGRAMIVCGDQHLSTLAHMGLETYTDGPVEFCVPAIGNIFWRWFYPEKPGSGPLADPVGYTGDFTDTFGNRFRLYAAANPTDVGFMGDRNQTLRRWNSRPWANQDSVRLCQGDGFGIVRIDTKARTYRVECWPYDKAPIPTPTPGPGDDPAQFKGWPVTFTQAQMDGRETKGILARIEFPGDTRVCAAVYHRSSDSLVYAYPLSEPGESLPAYTQGRHRLVLYDPENPKKRQSHPDLEPRESADKAEVIRFGF